MNFKLEEIILATNAEAFGIDKNIIITGISTDSRTVGKGDIFIAISGENYDGRDYAELAIEKGAVVVIAEEKINLPENKILLVENSRKAFLQIAGLYRRTLDTKIVAVTGSVGKTTTKEMIACVLDKAGKTLKTRANLNNEIGLSQMILELDNSYKYAVLELGVDGPDQMIEMTRAAMPNVVVVTNIGTSHLKAFGTRENIKKEKLTIKEGLAKEGTLILNGDDDYLKNESAVFYGIDFEDSDFKAEDIFFTNSETSFNLITDGIDYTVNLPTIGRHNVLNSLAAIAVGKELGISIGDSIDSLGYYKTEGMRQHIIEVDGFTIVEDCYNASPQSMKAAIETLSLMKTNGRKIAVLSDMLELGENEEEFHKEIGNFILENNIDLLFATGKLSKYMVELVVEGGNKNARYFEDKTQLAKALKAEIKPGDIAWLKASRGMRLEEVLNEIY